MLQAMLELDDIQPCGIRPLRRAEYNELGKRGAFEGERIELLCGHLVTMSPIGFRHRRITTWLTRYLVEHLDQTFEVAPGLPFAASEYSEPEPDMLVVHADATRDDHPAVALLLMEFSDSSIRKDRKVKLPIYAEAGVPEYWIVDLSTDGELTVEVYTDPTPTGYATVAKYRDGDVLRPKLVPIEIRVADLPR